MVSGGRPDGGGGTQIFLLLSLTLSVSVSLRDALLFLYFCTDSETVFLKESANQNFIFTFLGSICNFDGRGFKE